MSVEEIGEKNRRFSPGGGSGVTVGIPDVTNKSHFKGASLRGSVIVIPLSDAADARQFGLVMQPYSAPCDDDSRIRTARWLRRWRCWATGGRFWWCARHSWACAASPISR